MSDRDTASVADSTIGANNHIVSYGDIVAVVAMERCLHDDSWTDTAVRGVLRIGRRIVRAWGRRRCIMSRAEFDYLSEETHAILRRNTIRRIGRIVETPHSCSALLAIGNEGRRVGKIVLAAEHLVALAHFNAMRLRSAGEGCARGSFLRRRKNRRMLHARCPSH